MDETLMKLKIKEMRKATEPVSTEAAMVLQQTLIDAMKGNDKINGTMYWEDILVQTAACLKHFGKLPSEVIKGMLDNALTQIEDGTAEVEATNTQTGVTKRMAADEFEEELANGGKSFNPTIN